MEELTTPCQIITSSLTSIRQSAMDVSQPSERLDRLRAELARRNVDAMIIPTADAHSSEYPPARFERRAFISNFTGSAGTAVVTSRCALLWTDGRYFLQAENELSSEWTLMRQGERGVPSISKWLASLGKGSRVGVDPFLHTVTNGIELSQALADAGIELVRFSNANPVDVVWGSAQPSLPDTPVRKHPVRLAGSSVATKLRIVREKMRERGATHSLASMLDEVCWLFNIRGGDVPHCPIVTSYALVGSRSAVLYIDTSKVPEPVSDALAEAGVNISPYEDICDDLKAISCGNKEAAIWMNPDSTSIALHNAAGTSALLDNTPFAILKACKNSNEIAAIKNAHLKDGAAKIQFLRWLEEYASDGSTISEYKAGVKLEEFRSKQKGFVMTSFSSIAGYGPNGAIIHYRAIQGDCAQISNKEVFLLDSGGQYIDGTTDVTRTMHFGTPTAHQKRCFTKVLQGHIALDKAIFPEGTTGLQIDALARSALWALGLDYRHGTGHGVGASLNVHEGPQSIANRTTSHDAPILEGMVLSNEPGYYEDGKFGIRIENLCYVVEKKTPFKFGGKKYLGFEKLTFIPMEKNMMALDLMTSEEIKWVDNYHAEVWENISPRLYDEKDLKWLREKTAPIKTSKEERYF